MIKKESELSNQNRNSVPILPPGIGTRIRQAVKAAGSQKEAADAGGVTVATLQRYMKEQSAPTLEAIAGIAALAGMSLDDVAYGPRDGHAIAEPPANYGQAGDFVMIPRYDVVASAGHGAAVDAEDAPDELAFRADWLKREGLSGGCLAAIEAKGDSMEPTIADGDALLVDLSSTNPAQPGVYVMRADGLLVVKRLQMEPSGRVVVQSDNQSYRTMTGEPGDVDVVGRVVWVGRRL